MASTEEDHSTVTETFGNKHFGYIVYIHVHVEEYYDTTSPGQLSFPNGKNIVVHLTISSTNSALYLSTNIPIW